MATNANANLSREEIASRAYQIWEACGRPPGRELEHWLQAERELASPSGEANLEDAPASSSPPWGSGAHPSAAPGAESPMEVQAQKPVARQSGKSHPRPSSSSRQGPRSRQRSFAT